MRRKGIILIVWLAIWQLGAMVVGSNLLLPGPIDTAIALFGLLKDDGFYLDAAATIARCIVAIVLAVVLGFGLALSSYRHKIVRDVLALPVSLFKSIPVMAVAIYMILLLHPSNVPVLVCWVMCFPIVYTNLLTGLDSMDNSLLEMAKVYNISGRRKAKLIYVPSLYPYFSSAMSLMAGMSWKAVVTAEVLSIPKFSLGYELMNSKYYLNTDMLFAYVVAIIAISVAFERVVKYMLKRSAAHNYEYSKVAKLGAEKAGKDVVSSKIKLVDVNKSFGTKVVLKNLNLLLEKGKVTAIMGPSGSGKTTIARILSGLEIADSGEVRTADRVAYLFQEDRLLPWLNVYDNLAIVQEEVDDKRIHKMLKTVGLDEEAWKLPGELSGGMSYRVAMARAFIYDADFLIADEPFRGLDAETRQKAIDKLWTPGVKEKTVLLITHSEEDAKLASKTITI